MSSEESEPKDLQKDCLRLARRVRQLERLVRTSERVARQSQFAYRRTVATLEARTAELEEATQQAESAVLTKDLFLATMSHEIRTPMNGVIGCIDLVDTEALSPEQRDVVSTLQVSADSLLVLLNDVLDFAKLESGRTSLESVPFSLDQLLGDVAKLYGSSTTSDGVAINVDVAKALQSDVVGDPHRLRQVIQNLTSNAVKFTPEGEITLRARKGDRTGRVRFDISDTGLGMPEDVLEAIFEPFKQAEESTTRRFGGTGLGLAICKSLVTSMGGAIAVSSEAGVGSTFSFEINLGIAQESDRPTAPPEEPTRFVSREGSAHRILVVDDNPVNLMVAEKMLTKLGYEATLARGGREAIELAHQSEWSMILMDCSMPEVDGYQATRRIRAAEPEGQHVTIVALTAFAMPGDKERSLEAGMDHHLTKPLKLETLGDLLAATLHGSAAA